MAIVYEQIVTEYDLPATGIQFQLFDADVPQTTSMKLPPNVQSVSDLRYDVREDVDGLPNYKSITYQDPETFVSKQLNLTEETNAEEITLPSGTVIKVRNDKGPQYWTTFDQKTIYFDSYDSSVDSSLQPTKTSCLGTQYSELVISDNTIIDLPRELYVFLEFQALELCFDLYGGGAPNKVRNMARKARVRCQRNRDKLRLASSTGPNYGRNGATKPGPVVDITTEDYVPLPNYLKS